VLGGRAEGALTNEVIRKLSAYYGKAIRTGATAIEMQRSIMATIHHCTATDLKPTHDYCKKGKDSWCFYQKAIADPKQYDKVGLPKHADNIGTRLNPLVLEHVLPIYKRLSSLELLERCRNQLTQNANECLHSLIWCKVPKIRFLNFYRVQYGASAAIAEFNEGQAAALAQHTQLHLSHGSLSREIMKKKNQNRETNIKKKDLANTAGRMKIKKAAKAKSDAINIDTKLLLYGPGKY
jgi:hypothetical protein